MEFKTVNSSKIKITTNLNCLCIPSETPSVTVKISALYLGGSNFNFSLGAA